MRNALGGTFKVSGYIALVIFGLWSLIIEFAILNQAAGFWGVFIGVMFAPVTFFVAPWYALVAWGNWFPLVIVYGGGIVTAGLMRIGAAIGGD